MQLSASPRLLEPRYSTPHPAITHRLGSSPIAGRERRRFSGHHPSPHYSRLHNISRLDLPHLHRRIPAAPIQIIRQQMKLRVSITRANTLEPSRKELSSQSSIYRDHCLSLRVLQFHLH